MRPEVEHLIQQLGYQTLRPGQEEIINAALDGQDVLGILPTGSGKTLCFQAAGALRPGVTVVVEPLLALMRDQQLRLQASGERRVLAINSRLAPSELQLVLAHLGDYKFIFIAPEMLTRADILRALQSVQVGLLVVDEAHCIYQWGPDFRPAYLRLGDIRQRLGTPVMALTATAPQNVRTVITQQLRLQQAFVYAGSVDRPELFIGRELVQDGRAVNDRLGALLGQISGAAIVYCPSKKLCERLAQQFSGYHGRHSAYYHAGLDEHTRTLRERQFTEGSLDTLFATSAFGMGVDKADVRMVVYLGVPATLEEYMQAIGRAGRDGQAALTLLLYTAQDAQHTAGMLANLPSPSLVKTLYRTPRAYAGSDDPQIQLVLAYQQAGYSADEVNRALDARLSSKQKAFTAVVGFLQADGCIRAKLLRHFDSDAKQHDDFCCGIAEDAVLTQIHGLKQARSQGLNRWQEVFKQIFNVSD
mgnify:CR=1 FL=1